MRIVSILLALGLAGCRSAAPDVDPDVRVKIRLENHDPHLYDVATVDLDLQRENVVVHDRLAAPAGHLLEFPVEVIVKVPIGAGALVVAATPRGAGGQSLGGGEGQVMATSGAIAAVTVALLSDRNRPSRGRMGAGEDAGLPADVSSTEPDADLPPDAAIAVDLPPPPDATPVSCTARTHRLVAQAVVSVDYGTVPRDREDPRVSVSSGFSHEHVHDFVGWMRFSLKDIPPTARLTSARLSLVLIRMPTGIPRLAILYSASDAWDAETLTSEMAEAVARTARVSGDLGPPRNARADYPLDPARYGPFFTDDLADGAVTLGMISTTPLMSPETWADFYGLDPLELAPALDLETCE